MKKVGDVVKVIGLNGGANYQIGRRYTIYALSGAGYWQLRDESGWVGNAIMDTDLELWNLSKMDLKKKLEEIEDETFRVKMMLDYLDEEGKEEVVNNEFFAWHLLKLMNSQDPHKKEKVSKLLTTMSNNLDLKVITQR